MFQKPRNHNFNLSLMNNLAEAISLASHAHFAIPDASFQAFDKPPLIRQNLSTLISNDFA